MSPFIWTVPFEKLSTELRTVKAELAELKKTSGAQVEELQHSCAQAAIIATATERELSCLKKSSEKEISELRSMVGLLYAKLDMVVQPDSASNTSTSIAFADTPSSGIPDKIVVDISLANMPAVCNEEHMANASPTPRDGRKIELSFCGVPFDKSGLLYLIGCQGETSDYVNPHVLHASEEGEGVVASMSSVMAYSGSPDIFVQHETKEFNGTKNLAGSWMQVDIGASRRMMVNHYCLRCGAGGVYGRGGGIPRNWVLQASHIGGALAGEWISLKIHTNDTSLISTDESAFSVADWSIEEGSFTNQSYRYFRILQTGNNSDGYDDLVCSGIELYGVLTTHSRPC